MTKPTRSPAELRDMFGANLRLLSRKYPSISELSRQLKINRTQFNRYLSGESFPRPDVLDRICAFFEVDARILLEPVESIANQSHVLTGSVLAEFVGVGVNDVPQDAFPSGFFRFSRRSFINTSQFIVGLVYVFREEDHTFVRGYEAKDAMLQQGLTAGIRAREFRGYVTRQEEGVALVVSRRNSMTCSFNYLARVASFENNYWVGYVTRTVRESASGSRAVRLVYEHLGQNKSDIYEVARESGLVAEDNLVPFHRQLLQTEEPFR
ncbi:MAG: helix-turn-helix transcriptional regulator [Rhodobacteraceae bacterium]|nr:helix-turn-helix transcriptional regulator [Paracoccaceae bacterium]